MQLHHQEECPELQRPEAQLRVRSDATLRRPQLAILPRSQLDRRPRDRQGRVHRAHRLPSILVQTRGQRCQPFHSHRETREKSHILRLQIRVNQGERLENRPREVLELVQHHDQGGQTRERPIRFVHLKHHAKGCRLDSSATLTKSTIS